MNADAQLSDVELHQSFTINLSGKSMGAGVAGSAEVTLSTLPADEGTTRVAMVGTVETSGLLKKIPDSKVEAAVSSFLDSYFASVEKAASSL